MSVRIEALQTGMRRAGLPEGLALQDTLRASEAAAWRLTRALTEVLAAEQGRPIDVAHTMEPPAESATLSFALPHITLSWGEGEGEASSAREGGEHDYEVRGVLAEGGMGRLLLARQRTLGRDVVIKQVKPSQISSSATAALLTEARIAGSLEHPSIVPVHALGRDDQGRPLLVMKRIEGVVWRELVERPDHPDWDRVAPGRRDRLAVHLEILSSVCNAVHFANTRGVLHRDLKPDNVMVGYFGEVYLVDWGVALRRAEELPASGPIVGTPVFMAPEMLTGRPADVDARTDVYLLGATLHHVLTGRYRHEGPTLAHVALSVNASAPFDYGEGVAAELAAICNRATSAAPSARHPSALALREDIDTYLRHKDSIELTDRMVAALDEAVAAAATAEPALTRRRLLESQFGFEQALRAYPDNGRAREGLSRCLGAQLDHALDHEHLDEARSLLADCPTVSPAQRARLAALEQQVSEQRLARERLARLERDLDPSIGAGPRRILFVLVALSTVGMSVVMGPTRLGQEPLPRLFVVSSLFSTVILLAIAVLWRRLGQSSLNRRLIALLALTMVMLPLNRLSGMIQSSSNAQVIERDIVILTMTMAVGAIGLHRRLALPALAGLLCWWSTILWPAYLGFFFVGAVLAACGGVIWLWSPHCDTAGDPALAAEAT